MLNTTRRPRLCLSGCSSLVVDVDEVHITAVSAAEHECVDGQRVDDLRHADLTATVCQNQRMTHPVAFTLARGRH